ncbi:MAG: tetratricopeptide repeat protein [Lachnospiraceae bacterium]|nr:tetratricopeptide repeat protein [Lachnospiraceae bacterium]
MGTIILSTGNYAKTPYFFEKTYVNLFSLEELCYVLVENAEMLDQDIVSDKLVRWLDEQCALTELADNLYALIKEKASVSAFVGTILEYAGLYSPETVSHTVSLVSENAGLSPYEKQKARADHMFRNKRYILALEHYSSLLARLPEEDSELRARLHHNMGVVHARLFMFGHAQEEFMKAYRINGNSDSLEHFLAAKRMCDNDRDYVDYIARNPSLHETSLIVERMAEAASAQFDATQENRMLFTLRVCKEEGAASAADVQYYDEIENLTDMLKDDYRESVLG